MQFVIHLKISFVASFKITLFISLQLIRDIINCVHLNLVLEVKSNLKLSTYITHSSIRGVLIQSCPAGAKNFTNFVIHNIENRCAILTLFVYVDYYQNNQFYIVKIEFLKFCFIGTMIFGTLAWTIELYMSKYIIGEIFSSGRATLY